MAVCGKALVNHGPRAELTRIGPLAVSRSSHGCSGGLKIICLLGPEQFLETGGGSSTLGPQVQGTEEHGGRKSLFYT